LEHTRLSVKGKRKNRRGKKEIREKIRRQAAIPQDYARLEKKFLERKEKLFGGERKNRFGAMGGEPREGTDRSI